MKLNFLSTIKFSLQYAWLCLILLACGGSGAPDASQASSRQPSHLPSRAVSQLSSADCQPPTCSSPLFIDAIAEADWQNIDVAASEGTAGIRAALQQAQATYANRPVRIRLASGTYADNLGSEIFAQRLQRTSSTPIYIKAQQTGTVLLEHGINLLGVSWIAIDGITIGPASVGAWNASTQSHAAPLPLQASAGIHIAGEALYANQSANTNGVLNTAIYGQFQASHHIIIRNVTIQNMFELEAESGELSQGAGMDGMKFNQVEDLWVLNNSVRQTSRHGIDNVGVHRALFSGNVVANTGGGQGLEAKGGSVDITLERNVFYKVRRVELGGENTDATYYFSSDGLWNYEALRMVARNNLIIDPREAALEFAGCTDCAAIANSVLYTADYQVPQDEGTVYGGDAIRVHDSIVLDSSEGAGSDCQFWDGNDYVTVDPCWGVGANAPAPIRQVLRSANVQVVNNVFVSINGHFSNAIGGSTIPCPLNVNDGSADLHFDGNYWFNGSLPLPDSGCTLLPEGTHSYASSSAASTNPGFASSVDASSISKLARSAMIAMLPTSSSILQGKAITHASAPSIDFSGQSRPSPAAIGALQALPEDVSILAGAFADYTVVQSNGSISLRDAQGQVRQVAQRVLLSDGALAFDTSGVAGQAYRIYQAAFDRQPDAAGLGFWIHVMDQQASLAQVAGGFIASAEFQQLYGQNPSNEVFVTRLYNNILHRPPETGGYEFWLGVLQQGGGRAEVLAAIAESEENKGRVAPAIANGIFYVPYP